MSVERVFGAPTFDGIEVEMNLMRDELLLTFLHNIVCVLKTTTAHFRLVKNKKKPNMYAYFPTNAYSQVRNKQWGGGRLSEI